MTVLKSIGYFCEYEVIAVNGCIPNDNTNIKIPLDIDPDTPPALIVTAVDSFGALVAACEAALPELLLSYETFIGCDEDTADTISEIIDQLRAALELARGEG